METTNVKPTFVLRIGILLKALTNTWTSDDSDYSQVIVQKKGAECNIFLQRLKKVVQQMFAEHQTESVSFL